MFNQTNYINDKYWPISTIILDENPKHAQEPAVLSQKSPRYYLNHDNHSVTLADKYFSASLPEFSRQVSESDKAEKLQIGLINGGISQFSSGVATVKTWVLGFDRNLRQTKYRLIKTARWHTGQSGGELLEAFVFGSVRSLEEKTLISLKILGLLHIASASGANVLIILQLAKLLVNRLPSRKWQFYLLFLVVIGYAELAEFSPSIVRAGISALYGQYARLVLNVPTQSLVTLLVSMSIMLAIKPNYLTNFSFQLSCLATFGLGFFSSLPAAKTWQLKRISSLQLPASQATQEKTLIDGLQLQTASQSEFWTGIARNVSASYRYCVQTLSDSFKTSLAAQVLVAPFIWLRTGEWSPFSLVANTLLIWMTPLITQLSLALLVITAWAGKWPLAVCWYLQRIIGKFLNLITEIFLFGVANLSQVVPALSFHSLDWIVTCSWWLLSGLLVVKTYQLTHRKHDDAF